MSHSRSISQSGTRPTQQTAQTIFTHYRESDISSTFNRKCENFGSRCVRQRAVGHELACFGTFSEDRRAMLRSETSCEEAFEADSNPPFSNYIVLPGHVFGVCGV